MEYPTFLDSLAIAYLVHRGLTPIEYIGAGANGFVLKVSDEANNTSALKIVPVILRPHEDKADGIIRERKFYQYLKKEEKTPNLAEARTWWSTEDMEKSFYLKWNKTLRKQLNVEALDYPTRAIKETSGEFKLRVYFVQMEYYASGNLRTWLERNSDRCGETYSLRIHLFCDILNAVAFLHKRGLMHRDICPNNIFLAKENSRLYAVLGDFDSIVSCGEQALWPLTKTREAFTTAMGTDPYAAPEIYGGNYDKQCDLFSLGVIALNLFFNILYYHALHDAIYKIHEMDGFPRCIFADDTTLWQDILKFQLSRTPERRMSGMKLLEIIKEKHQPLYFETVGSVDSIPVFPKTSPTGTLAHQQQSLHLETVVSVDSTLVSPELPPTAIPAHYQRIISFQPADQLSCDHSGTESPVDSDTQERKPAEPIHDEKKLLEPNFVKQLVLFCVELPSPCCAEGRKMYSRRELKLLVIFLNSLVAGVVILAGCAMSYIDSPVLRDIVKYLSEDFSTSVSSFQSWNNVLIGGIVLGTLIFVMGFLGCCVARKHVKWMLTIFSIVLMIIVAAHVAVVVLVYVDKDKVHDKLISMLKDAGEDAQLGGQECKMFQDLANNNVCCGISTTMPQQCPLNCTAATLKDCPDVVNDALVSKSKVAGACLIAMLFIELVSVIFSILLCRSADKQYSESFEFKHLQELQ